MATSSLSTTPARPATTGRGGSRLRRVAIFVLGALLNLLGVAGWLFSVLLTAPLMLAGVWVWSREFDWAHRLLGRLRRWVDSLWLRVKRHPVRWGVATVISVAATATGYLFLMP